MRSSQNNDCLRLPKAIRLALVDHLQAVYPEEGCGLLAGSRAEQRATTLYTVENVAHNRRTQFSMAPHTQLSVFTEIEAAGLDLLAIYHSHPNGPETPSATDVAQAYYPDLVQVIVSLASNRPKLRAFWLSQTNLHEIPLIFE